ncbi:MAG: glycosyltransferase family 2 protein [Clostridiales bacterium]|nr:glycosyltransferase family 2 protein [Clostridiales bacterium]
MEKISIITPVFNRQDCIVRCLDSVATQIETVGGNVEIEHVIVDDGSTDGTVTLLKEYASKNQHIKLILFDHNKGTNAARNAAITEASGHWCLFLDSDDNLLPNALLNICDTVEKNKAYRYYMFSIDYRHDELTNNGRSHVFSFTDFLSMRVNGDFVHFVERSVLLKYPFDEELRIHEGIFFLSFYKEVGKMLFTDIPIIHVELNRDDSVSLTIVRFNDTFIKRRLKGAQLHLDFYLEDYLKEGLHDLIYRWHSEIIDNAILLGNYKLAKEHLAQLEKRGLKRYIYSLLIALRLGIPYKKLLQTYLGLKHKKPKKDIV